MEVTVQEAKAHLSRLLRRVEGGETVVIRRGGERVALLVRAPSEDARRDIWGDLDGEIGAEFDAPLHEFEPYS